MFSCTPEIFPQKEILNEDSILKSNKEATLENEVVIKKKKNNKYTKNPIIKEIEVILPDDENINITKNFINALELSLYKKNIKNISFNINLYSDYNELQDIISKNIVPGKIFLGPLTSDDTSNVFSWCEKGAIFFSFASNRSLAKDCVYLINFFPEDDLITLFNFFNSDERIALLYPENDYGFYISDIVDKIASNSNSILINRASYNEDLSNAREAIKELSKYELRKYELERQKKILKTKNDELSLKSLRKIEKFETIGKVDFTHIIISDYNVRLLQIAPLLPFYDIDPDKIQFVGTGVWDDDVFFHEPSLQGAIFPGVAIEKRQEFINSYLEAYDEKPIRTSTIMYDLVGLISYLIDKSENIGLVIELLNNNKINYDGIDGEFSFDENLIKRNLDILEISNGKAVMIK